MTDRPTSHLENFNYLCSRSSDPLSWNRAALQEWQSILHEDGVIRLVTSLNLKYFSSHMMGIIF